MKSTPVAETRRSIGAPSVGSAGAGAGAGAGVVAGSWSLQPTDRTANARKHAAGAFSLGRSRPARDARKWGGGGGNSHRGLLERRGLPGRPSRATRPAGRRKLADRTEDRPERPAHRPGASGRAPGGRRRGDPRARPARGSAATGSSVSAASDEVAGVGGAVVARPGFEVVLPDDAAAGAVPVPRSVPRTRDGDLPGYMAGQVAGVPVEREGRFAVEREFVHIAAGAVVVRAVAVGAVAPCCPPCRPR